VKEVMTKGRLVYCCIILTRFYNTTFSSLSMSADHWHIPGGILNSTISAPNTDTITRYVTLGLNSNKLTRTTGRNSTFVPTKLPSGSIQMWVSPIHQVGSIYTSVALSNCRIDNLVAQSSRHTPCAYVHT